ncbi:MOSC domain-containing protein [Pseudonocardia sp. GCM10023141]|uniref:MOSC domain-containing protein n=1 Tax=Pseudonocardia sp. GCM10023141 TaxID=3252653 RepID=UPI0036164983
MTTQELVTTQESATDADPVTGTAAVTDLVTYPIKGCAGTSVAESMLTPAGLAHDRTFLVIDEDGLFRSQRKTPELAVLRPEMSDDGARMTLDAPGIEPLTLDVDLDGPRRDITLFSDPYRGMDQGDGVAGWLSQLLGATSRLVRVPPEHHRVVAGRTPGTSAYADSTALLLASDASLALLNERLTDRGSPALPMNRFRPNIVVSGWAEPHAEDLGRRIRIGAAELGYAKICIRCAVTLVEQVVGRKAGPEPLRTLADYRRAAAGGVAFGAMYAVLRTGRLAVGDRLDVQEWGPSELC